MYVPVIGVLSFLLWCKFVFPPLSFSFLPFSLTFVSFFQKIRSTSLQRLRERVLFLLLHVLLVRRVPFSLLRLHVYRDPFFRFGWVDQFDLEVRFGFDR